MNCADHCALCGQDLKLKARAYWRNLEVYECAKACEFKGMWAGTTKPEPFAKDEDGEAVCECAEADSLERRAHVGN